MPALCNILVQGETGAPPVALGDVLKALYAIIATDAGSGAGTSELFASGGIHSLVSCSSLGGRRVAYCALRPLDCARDTQQKCGRHLHNTWRLETWAPLLLCEAGSQGPTWRAGEAAGEGP